MHPPWLENLLTPPPRIQALTAGLLALLLLAGARLVYQTGGVKFAMLHCMYLPICIAGLMLGVRGGLLAAIAAGMLLGPYLPLDTRTGETQLLHNWLYRMAFFCMVGGLVGLGADMLRRQMALLTWIADHDPHSGMLARTGVVKHLRHVIATGEPGKEMSIIVVNMHNFLEIQNTFGLDFGERLLTRIESRWKQAVPAGIPIAMVQPDRLCAVFPSTEEALRLRPSIEANMREPYLVGDVPVYVNFNIGAARCPTHAGQAEEVLQKASIAMHHATVRKQSFALYDSSSDRTSRDNLMLLGMVPAAIERGELGVWHQAKFALDTAQVCGTEALVRWAHPERGLIPPAAFIPQAEETALINRLTYCIVTAALADMTAWEAQGQRWDLAINLSAQNFHDAALLDFLRQTTRAHGLDPQRIEIEITESAVMSNFDVCCEQIAQLRDHGYRVAIDDFGTGHSSLSYLRRLPITTLKIDQTFVKHLATSANDQKIVRSILGLASSFGLTTVAEGIEDAAAQALLREWGCQFGQGYFLHRPAPLQALLQRVEAQHA